MLAKVKDKFAQCKSLTYSDNVNSTFKYEWRCCAIRSELLLTYNIYNEYVNQLLEIFWLRLVIALCYTILSNRIMHLKHDNCLVNYLMLTISHCTIFIAIFVTFILAVW